MLKDLLHHLLANTIIDRKPTLNYAELSMLLSRAANIVNDWLIGVKSLTEDKIVPLTVNQLLLGRTSTAPLQDQGDVPEDYTAANTYLQELTQSWWKLWKERAFPTLLPYYWFKEAGCHRNLRPGEICLMQYQNKVKAT